MVLYKSKSEKSPTAQSTDLQSLVESVGTPLYVYDLQIIRSVITDICAAFEYHPFSLLFASMANDHPTILNTIAETGVGLCVNSLTHLTLGLEAGFSLEKIQFTSTGVPSQELLQLKDSGIVTNLDSPGQVRTWFADGSGGMAGARLNSGRLLLRPNEECDRIGMDANDLAISVKVANDLGGCINGLHVYTGTNFQDVKQMLPPIRALFEVAASVRNLDYINIGGGVGVNYAHSGRSFDIRELGQQVTALAKRLSDRLERPVRLFFEPGRSLTATAGQFITRVTDVKILNGTRYVSVDGSIALFPRPFHHPESSHRAWLLRNSNDPGEASELATVVGRTTFSRDILVRCMLPPLTIGDLLVFDDAGAYCQSMISRFLGQREPNYVFISGDNNA